MASKSKAASKGKQKAKTVKKATAKQRTTAKKRSVKKTAAKSAKTTSSSKSTAKKTVAKKTKPAKKVATKRGSAKKAVPKKKTGSKSTTSKNAAAKKTIAKNASVKTKAKATTKKTANGVRSAKKATVKKAAVKPSPAKPSSRTKGAATERSSSKRPSRSASSRRSKDKDQSANKSPFSHTDHASIFRAVEARKAAAKAKQAKMESTHHKPRRTSGRRLTDKQLGAFEEMLLRIRAELLRQIAYLRGASLTRSDEVNPEEDGTDAFERQLALKLAAGEGDSIFEIDEALERIRLKVYGVCEECECVIPTARLKALPFARRCVECQSKVEQKPNMTDHRHY